MTKDKWFRKIYLQSVMCTAYHRHGVDIPDKHLNELSNLLLDFEKTDACYDLMGVKRREGED